MSYVLTYCFTVIVIVAIFALCVAYRRQSPNNTENELSWKQLNSAYYKKFPAQAEKDGWDIDQECYIGRK